MINAVMLALVVGLVVALGAWCLLKRERRVAASLRAQAAHNLLRLDQRESEIDELRVKLERAQLSLAECRGELSIVT